MGSPSVILYNDAIACFMPFMLAEKWFGRRFLFFCGELVFSKLFFLGIVYSEKSIDPLMLSVLAST